MPFPTASLVLRSLVITLAVGAGGFALARLSIDSPAIVAIKVLAATAGVAGTVLASTGMNRLIARRTRTLATYHPVTGLQRFHADGSEPLSGRYAVLFQLREADRLRLDAGNASVEAVMAALADRLSVHHGADCSVYAYTDTSLLVTINSATCESTSEWIGATVGMLSRTVSAAGRSHVPTLRVFVVPDIRYLTPREVSRRLEVTMQGSRGASGDVFYYDQDLDRRVSERVRMQDALRHAIDREELRLVYQPIVDGVDGNLLGAEVLMRWTSAEFSEVSPSTFIPIAEESGSIVDLTEWMIVRAWQENTARGDDRFPFLSVNVSPAHLARPGFLEGMRTLVRRHGIDTDTISIEITEGILVDETITRNRVLDGLKELGFSLSVDDFGTGYSNLAYLHRLRVDRIKIDRAFVQDLLDGNGERNERLAVVVEAMIFMAKTLTIDILAEGVETEAQANALRELGCDMFQGYLFGRPEPMAAAASGDSPAVHRLPA